MKAGNQSRRERGHAEPDLVLGPATVIHHKLQTDSYRGPTEKASQAPPSSSVGISQRLWIAVAATVAWPMATRIWSRPSTTPPAA